MSAEVAETLRRAKALIDSPEKWIKGTGFAVAADGTECRCILGAFSTVRAESRNTVSRVAPLDALRRLLPVSIPDFNDAPNTTHTDVMALFDRAIAAEEAAS